MAVADAKPSYSRDSLRWQPTTPKAPHVFQTVRWTHLLDALLDDLFDERRWGLDLPGQDCLGTEECLALAAQDGV